MNKVTFNLGNWELGVLSDTWYRWWYLYGKQSQLSAIITKHKYNDDKTLYIWKVLALNNTAAASSLEEAKDQADTWIAENII